MNNLSQDTKESFGKEIEDGSSVRADSHEKDIEPRRHAHLNTCQDREYETQGKDPIINRSAFAKSIPDDRSERPVPSVLSMKSDHSKGLLENFKGDLTQDTGKYNPILSPEIARCDVCSKKAGKSCLTCCASFCEDHVRPHYTAPALQRHNLVEATADLEQRLCQHHNKVLDLFCQNDNKPLCALCLVEGHKEHEIIPNPEDSNLTPVLHMDQELIIREDIPPPGPIKLSSVNLGSVSLNWELPEGLTGFPRFRVSVKCSRDQRYLEVQGSKIDIQGLIPHVEYEVMVATLYGQGHQSTWVSESIYAEVPVPQSVVVTTTTTSIRVTWRQSNGLHQASYLVTLKTGDECLQRISTDALECSFSDLLPVTKYTIEAITVSKNGHPSKPVVECFRTNIPIPENVKADCDKFQPSTINLSWTSSDNMNHIPHNFIISYYTYDGKDPKIIYVDSCYGVIAGLTEYAEYKIEIFTHVESIGKSDPASIRFFLGIPPVTDLKVTSYKPTSVLLQWKHDVSMYRQRFCYQVSYHTDGSDLKSFTTSNNCGVSVENLKLNRKYTISMTAVIKEKGVTSDPVSLTFETGLSPPGPIQFTSVKPDSVSLCWGLPEDLTSPPQFIVSLFDCHNSIRKFPCTLTRDKIMETRRNIVHSMIVPHLEASFDGLVPGTMYIFSVASHCETGIESPEVVSITQTGIPGPVDFYVNLKDFSCTWKQPPGVSGESYQLCFFRDGKCIKAICTTSLTWTLSDLDFEAEYIIRIVTLYDKQKMSKPLSETVYIDTPVPEDLNVDSVSATSAELGWKLRPVMKQIPHSFLISYQSEGTEPETISTDSYNTTITSLKPDTEYMVSVSTIIQRGGKSRPVTTVIHTNPPAPGPVQVTSVSSDSVSLCWGAPEGLAWSQKSKVSYTNKNSAKVPGQDFCVEDLIPGEEYEFSVATVSDKGRQSSTVLASICTEVPAPVNVHVDLIGKSVQVSWSKPAGLGEVSYLLTLYSDGECKKTVATKLQTYSLPGLQYDTEYTISISSVLPNGRQSKPVSEVIHQRKKPRVD